MRAIKILRYGQNLKVENYNIPTPKSHQALIKVKYSPINPADVYFCKGIYGIRKQLPAPVGFEGVGTIIDSSDHKLINQDVSFMPSQDSEFGKGGKYIYIYLFIYLLGAWSEYTIANIEDIIMIPQNQDLRQLAFSFINPFTALGFLGVKEIVKKNNFKNVLFSSSSSAVSLISLRLLREVVPQLNIHALKRKDQLLDLSIAGIKMIDVEVDFEDNINGLFDGPCVYFDSFAGPQCGKILSRLPIGSKVVSYGSSSMTHIGFINPQDLIFKNKTLEGFWMNQFYDQLKQTRREEYFNYIIGNMSEGQIFHTQIQEIFPLTEIKDAMEIYRQSMGQGKILLSCEI